MPVQTVSRDVEVGGLEDKPCSFTATTPGAALGMGLDLGAVEAVLDFAREAWSMPPHSPSALDLPRPPHLTSARTAHHTLCAGSPTGPREDLTRGWLIHWPARGHCQGVMQKSLPNGVGMTCRARWTGYFQNQSIRGQW